MIRHVVRNLVKLHRDERGAEGLEKLLIVAAIVLPLLGLLIIFRDEIKKWVGEIWGQARGKAEQNQSDYFGDSVPE